MNLQLQERNPAIDFIKKLFWLYFILLLFEGALRKWVLPGLATPLLIVRDPVALFILFYVLVKRLWTPGGYVLIGWILILLSFISTLVAGHGNLFVAIYGLRIMMIHFPVLFVMGSLLNKEDIHQMMRVLLFISLGMTVLVALQFFSPQSAWVNRGIGADASGSGFSGAAGFYRVPGTFSFTNGLSLFYGWVVASLIYFWGFAQEKISRLLLLTATLSFVAVLPMLISRTVVFETVLSLLFYLLIAKKGIGSLMKIGFAALILYTFFVLAQNFSFFDTATNALTTRFDNAGRSEGGIEGTLVNRFLGGMYDALADPNSSFIGKGLGMGSNAGAQLLAGRRTFLVSEEEWGRLIGESGILIGLGLIFLRIVFLFSLLLKSWRSQIQNANALPWMLLSFGFVIMIQGQWSQPTSLGFAVLIGGSILAALKHKQKAINL